MPAGHMPNPANQACTVCHTTAPADYTTTTLAANAVLHTGITSGCITCHGAPNSTPPVFYPNYTPKDAVLSPVHIPTSTTACEACHSPTVFTSFSGTTMTSAKHTSMFAVIGKTCDACHELTTPKLSFYGVTNLTVRPSGHHVGQDCSGCHNTNNWDGGAQQRAATKTAARNMVVTVVKPPAAGAMGATGSGNVFARRTGTPRVGLPAIGAPTRSLVTSVSLVSHAGVTANCASCHNGMLAAGKPAGHIASNNTCENCHTTLAWIPARFEHQGVTASCSSCHNGVLAPGKPAGHVQSTNDCGACHGTIAWQPAIFSHVAVSPICQTCHNGISATGKQADHVPTAQDCGSCHNTLGWTIMTMPAQLRPLLRLRPAPTGGPTK